MRSARRSRASLVICSGLSRSSQNASDRPRRARGAQADERRQAWPAPTRREGDSSGSGKVESIEIHDLVPRAHEVPYEFLACVVGRVDFREGAELGVRPEYQIDAAGSPLDFSGFAIAAL